MYYEIEKMLNNVIFFVFFLFFFQAEDGIRDRTVTGVQTCALPICVGRFALHGGQRRGAVRRLGGLKPLRLQQGAHHLADVGLVVHEQDARAHVAESTMEKVAPPPGVSATVMLPLCASTVCRTSASPSPVPSCLVVKYGSNTRCRSSSEIPRP